MCSVRAASRSIGPIACLLTVWRLPPWRGTQVFGRGYHDTFGAAERHALQEQVSKAGAEGDTQPLYRMFWRVFRYAAWRFHIELGRLELAQVHYKRDLRQLKKLELLFNKAKEEGLLPSEFDYRRAGDAWRRHHTDAGGVATPFAAAAWLGGGGAGGEQRRRAENAEQASYVHAAAIGGAAEGGGSQQQQHCAGGGVLDDDDDGGAVPPWVSLFAENSAAGDAIVQHGEHQQDDAAMEIDGVAPAAAGAGQPSGQGRGASPYNSVATASGANGRSLRELLLEEADEALREWFEEDGDTGGGDKDDGEVEVVDEDEEEGGEGGAAPGGGDEEMGGETRRATSAEGVEADESDDEEEFRI